MLPTSVASAPSTPSTLSTTSSAQAGAAGATSTGVNGAGPAGNGTYGAPTAQVSPFLGGAANVGYDAGMLLCFTIAVIGAVVLI